MLSDSVGDDVLVTTRPAPRATPKRRPNYAVIIENDEHHTFAYVIEALQRVCGHDLEHAYRLTLEAHNSGRAVVWSGALEPAELKRDQIREFGADHYGPRPVSFPLGVYLEALPTS